MIARPDPDILHDVVKDVADIAGGRVGKKLEDMMKTDPVSHNVCP